ncbi:Tex family protein [Marinigracilibium pacificum]|uniref:RNA-binding transcriptional accessory protein n=1 Tax=Marinigracilibium pacificum TaxID=2729599 RepID=A0A848J2T7_9BACT|nr:Tex family protein [Marinigracilibium pacificum]NMM49648.1 RNA-binding transcriptional accessory protein [Marinigracilibium pacificum]
MSVERHVLKIASELNLPIKGVTATVELLEEGATIPFISRYRKERTGSLDEVAISSISDRLTQLKELDKRRETVLKSIDDQGKLTPELKKAIEEAETMAKLEDLYLPYKPKRRTKGTIAKEKGLEPLATKIFEQDSFDVIEEAEKFLSDEKDKEVKSAEEALQGARDIIAEWVNEDAEVREAMRNLFRNKAIIKSKVITGKEEEAAKYRDYFEWEEPLAKAPSHRILAMRRGEKELFLMLDISVDKDEAINLVNKKILKGNTEASKEVEKAIEDSYKRLLKPAIETEMRMESKKGSDEEAIKVFAENLRELLLASPLGEKAVLAIDPGFRTGCKVVALDKQGKLLENTTIFPNEPQKRVAESEAVVMALVQKYELEAIAIGNGTAGRETEAFCKNIKFPFEMPVISVNESGASIYSASDVAREEFPDQDLTVRGAVSIGRRLKDPLAELVKIDPKSIGVGQYQHDVDQTSLRKGLDSVVESCVNAVGVEVNLASKQLLTYVSGLGPTLAKNIIEFRDENGAFTSREDLKKVKLMGDKAYEQAAGFLRIRNASNPLDSSAVHPESYAIVEKMAADLGASVEDLIKNSELRSKIDLKKYVTEEVGLPTLTDIMKELDKPGRDPRAGFEIFSFAEGVEKVEDLKPGMVLPGIVTNVTKFGAFVDIGVHQDGLVHISELSNEFVSDPAEVVKVSQKVEVRVVELDHSRNRISLSMKDEAAKPARKKNAKKNDDSEGDMAEKLKKLKGLWKN